MTRLFRSKSCGLVGLSEFNSAPPPSPFFHRNVDAEEDDEDDGEEEYGGYSRNPISTPFISPATRFGGARSNDGGHNSSCSSNNNNQFAILDILVAALRKSLVTCSVERDDVSSMDISYPTEVRHVSHVTFDRFNGFLGLPTELEPEVPRKVPSARFWFIPLLYSCFVSIFEYNQFLPLELLLILLVTALSFVVRFRIVDQKLPKLNKVGRSFCIGGLRRFPGGRMIFSA